MLSLGQWLQTTSPHLTWDWPYLAYIRTYLGAITRGDCKRLMLFVPPRHGKSTLATIHYPAYRLEYTPGVRVVVACYNQTLAEKFSRRVRSLVRQRGRVPLDPERQAVHDWLTLVGGGLRAVGIGGGITGQGADLLIIDDPVKSREEANSEAYRERCWDWYTDDIYTRLEPGAAIVLIATRWHEDDLAGRILASEQAADWTVVKLPAEAEADDPLGRPLGAALCPERYDLAALTDLRATLGEGAYAALFQQRPQPEGGLMFQRAWFGAPVLAAPKEAMRIRYWDKAGTLGGDGAATAGVLMARDASGVFYVEHVVHGRWGAVEREQVIQQTAAADGRQVTVWVEQEPGSGGKESAESTIRTLAGFKVFAERVTGDKVTRAEPFAAQCAARNVHIVAGDWNAGYLDEITVFPSGRRKDRVDASSGAFNKLATLLRRTAGGAVAGARPAIAGYRPR
jgi:predicted phage terminase large subunit-like protein